jgi:hypothetical protein
VVTASPAPFRRLLVCTGCGQSGSSSRGSAAGAELVERSAALAFYCQACAAELAVEPPLRSL